MFARFPFKTQFADDCALEIVAENRNPTVWDEPFAAAEEAAKEGIESIEDEGIDTFIGVKGA